MSEPRALGVPWGAGPASAGQIRCLYTWLYAQLRPVFSKVSW